ncbi:MAG TPA: PRC-barrel domain-containing protein [Allosphingosinicella sp.]|jgi:sporulation protein YlmC with PRC-barrel domain
MADHGRDDQGSGRLFGGGWGSGSGHGAPGRSGDDERVHRDRGAPPVSRNRGPDTGRERDFGHDDRHQGLPIEETSRLIASNKVEGTPVYSRDRHRLGTVYNFMVDKVSGQVEYAVLRYGGFMGVGQRYYPLPWKVLTYHRDAGGYVIDMTAGDFESAPSFDRTDEPEFDHDYGRRVHSWYGLEY